MEDSYPIGADEPIGRITAVIFSVSISFSVQQQNLYHSINTQSAPDNSCSRSATFTSLVVTSCQSRTSCGVMPRRENEARIASRCRPECKTSSA